MRLAQPQPRVLVIHGPNLNLLGEREPAIYGSVTLPQLDASLHTLSAELGVRDGAYDGELTDVPPTGETRAQLLIDYAAAHGLDLAQSVAYADSTSDLPMLEVAGFPVAVNPETRLAALARKRGWLVEHWDKAPGAPKVRVPIGDRRRSKGGLANPLLRGAAAAGRGGRS